MNIKAIHEKLITANIILFVATMLQVGVWTKFCPSKWLFEKLGFKKSEL